MLRENLHWLGTVCLISCLVACRPDTGANQLVVLTYNIHHGEGMDGRIDLERIARVIREAAPDLVALQEVDSVTNRSGGVDQAATLAALTGMYVVYGPAFAFGGGKYGNAALTQWKPEAVECIALPGEPRSLLRIRVRPPQSTGPIYFYATHLDTDSIARRAAVPLIEQALPAAPEASCILAGDLNALPESPTLQALCKVWTFPQVGMPLPTFPVDTPDRQIDYILLRPLTRWSVVSASVPNESMASDHRPLRVVLEMSE
jgi:endonuclease/exonuclease/phosphatase family metal-dependent hydrolase